MQAVLREARDQNWVVEKTSSGHWKCKAPDGKTTVILSGTASDKRSIKNGIARMRQAGFIWKEH